MAGPTKPSTRCSEVNRIPLIGILRGNPPQRVEVAPEGFVAVPVRGRVVGEEGDVVWSDVPHPARGALPLSIENGEGQESDVSQP